MPASGSPDEPAVPMCAWGAFTRDSHAGRHQEGKIKDTRAVLSYHCCDNKTMITFLTKSGDIFCSYGVNVLSVYINIFHLILQNFLFVFISKYLISNADHCVNKASISS